jgi:hypothetical protein
MVKVYSPARRNGFVSAGLTAVLILVLISALLLPEGSYAQAQPPAAAKAAAGQEKGATKDEAAKSKSEAGAAASTGDKKDDDASPEPPPDPSKTLRVAPVEVFKDPNAEAVVDLKKFTPIRSRPIQREDLALFKEMAGNPAAPVDPVVIRRVVSALIGELTDTRNIQALIDPPPGMTPTSPAMQAIESATTNLVEPLFVGRANKSVQFLNEYNRVLLASLPPLLKHHLVPRVQAMIVLGQSANPDAYKLFLDEIKNPKQTVWVKLWAIRGVTNIIRLNPTPRLNAVQTSEAAHVIADYLDSNKELPWPVQLRALEALSYLRQGFVPTAPKAADMAATAMRILADPKARPDVRAEAARALGTMQITNAVPSFNFNLVAYAAAQLAAQVGDQIVASYTEKGSAINATRAEYLTSLLVGPVHQTFDGTPGMRDSGLLHSTATAAASARSQIQKILDQIEPVSRASLDLVRSPASQVKARRQDLVERVAVLKEFLSKNEPANLHLVPGDLGFLKADKNQPVLPSAPAAAKVAAGVLGGK